MTTTEPRTIDEADARRIASEWHGGQSTALYAFASSGHIATDLLDEASRELADQARRAVDSPSEADNVDLVDLAALVAWIGQQNRRNRLRAALALVQLDPSNPYASDTDEPDTYPDRWCAIARSSIDGSYLYTTAPEPLDALAQCTSDEYPQDWTPFYLFDLDDTEVDEDNDPAAVRFVSELEWTHTVPSEGVSSLNTADSAALDALADALREHAEHDGSGADLVAITWALVESTGRTLTDTPEGA